jgi:hypothetical protein
MKKKFNTWRNNECIMVNKSPCILYIMPGCNQLNINNSELTVP